MKKKVITVFIALFVFKIFLSFLDYKGSSSPELKNEILKYFTPEDIIKGETYARSGYGMSVLRSAIFFVIILMMTFSALPVKLEAFCVRLSKNRFFITSVIFISLFYSVFVFAALPVNFYLSYINEHRFGFSNMTIGFWFFTRLKSYLLAMIFISLTGSVALLIIKKFRLYSVIILPIAGLVAGSAMMIIYPSVILPVFYKIKTVDNPALERRIHETAQKSGVNVDKIYVIKESDYSRHTNAFFTGFGSSKKIYLYDTLLQNNTEDEVISILSHETGHWVYNHNMKGLLTGFILSLGGFVLIYFCVRKLQEESGYSIGELYSPSMVPLYLLLFVIASGFTDPVEMAVSREMERSADYYALEITGNTGAFITSEIRIARDNRSRLNRHSLPEIFSYSHPMTIDRIKMAENYRRSMKQ